MQSHRTAEKERYDLPRVASEYFPDPDAAVDRWLQAQNASNARTTAELIRRLVSHPVTAVLDPYAGGGSTATAARLLNFPFLGIELDPVLACASVVKSKATARHAHMLGPLPEVLSTDGSADEALNCPASDEDRLIVRCLQVLRTRWLRSGRDAAAMRPLDLAAELDRLPPPSQASRIRWGNSSDLESWTSLLVPPAGAVIYTSPPFGPTSPRMANDADVRSYAEKTLVDGNVALSMSGPGEFPDYLHSALAVFDRAYAVLDHFTAIIEHEPGDDGSDARGPLADRLRYEYGAGVVGLRVLETAAFSRRGTFSLVVCEIRK